MARNQLPMMMGASGIPLSAPRAHSDVSHHPHTPKDHNSGLIYPDGYPQYVSNPGGWGALASPPPSPSPWDRYLKDAHEANAEPGPSTHANALPQHSASLVFTRPPSREPHVFIPPNQPQHRSPSHLQHPSPLQLHYHSPSQPHLHSPVVLPSPTQEYVKGTVDRRNPPPDAWMKTPMTKYEPLYRKVYGRSGKPDSVSSNPWANAMQRIEVMNVGEYNKFHSGAVINPRILYDLDLPPILHDILLQQPASEVVDLRGSGNAWEDAAREFAILPASSDIRLVCEFSPYEVLVHSSKGVTLENFIKSILRTFCCSITKQEWAALSPQQQSKAGTAYYKNRSGQQGSPSSMPKGIQRSDLLLDYTCVAGIRFNPDLCRERYGYIDRTTFELVMASNVSGGDNDSRR